MTAGPRYVGGRYPAERPRNSFVQTHLGGRILSASQLPLFKLRPHPQVRLRLPDGTHAGTARALRDDERAEAMAAFCDTVNPFDYLEC